MKRLLADKAATAGDLPLQFGNHGRAPGAPIKWRKVEVRSL